MNYSQLLSPKTIDIDGNTFAIGKIPAFQAQTIYKHIIEESKDHGLIGVTMLSHSTILEMMNYVTVKFTDGSWIPLDIESSINQYCGNLSTLHKLLVEIYKINFSFLFDGGLQNLIQVLEAGV